MRKTRAVTHTVSFRLDEHLFGQLAEQAAAKGISPAALARDFVREALTDPLAQRTLSRLADLQSQLSAVQQSMRHATFTILCQLGSNEEVAEKFVNDYMAE